MLESLGFEERLLVKLMREDAMQELSSFLDGRTPFVGFLGSHIYLTSVEVDI